MKEGRSREQEKRWPGMPIGKKLVFLTDPGEEELEIELLCRVLFLIIDSTHRKMGSFGSHGHIMNFSTCRARVIRWPVGRIVHSNSHASQTKTRGQQRDCLGLDHPELHLNLWLWRLGLSLDHDFKMPGSPSSVVGTLTVLPAVSLPYLLLPPVGLRFYFPR